MNNYFVYMVRCSDDSIYTGITNDLEKRMKMHNLKKVQNTQDQELL